MVFTSIQRMAGSTFRCYQLCYGHAWRRNQTWRLKARQLIMGTFRRRRNRKQSMVGTKKLAIYSVLFNDHIREDREAPRCIAMSLAVLREVTQSRCHVLSIIAPSSKEQSSSSESKVLRFRSRGSMLSIDSLVHICWCCWGCWGCFDGGGCCPRRSF